MSTTLTSVDIGQAERATRALLDRLLHDVSISFEQWVVLRARALDAEPVARDAFTARIAAQLRVDPAFVDDVVAGLEATGLLEADGHLRLTAAGRACYDTVQEGAARTAAALYGAFDAADLAIAHRVLVEVVARADAMLEGSRS